MKSSDDAQGVGDQDAAMTRADWWTLTARVVLGLWFVYSGGHKVWVGGLHAFAEDIDNYRLLPEMLITPAAYAVPWVEIAAGLCLVLGCWMRGAILIMLGLVTGFSIFIGWAWQQQLDISCGCHGSDEPINYWWKALEFSGYFLVLGWLGWREYRKGQKIQNMA